MADIISFGNHRAIQQAAPEVKNDNIFFPVNQVNLTDLTGMPDTGLSAIVRTDTDTILAVHGKRYTLTSNEEIFNALDRVITRSPHLDTNGMTILDRVAYAGGRTVRQYMFPEHRVETLKGDFTELRLTVVNSYDGSTNLNVKMGGYRLHCLNGMASGDWFGEYKNRHTSMFSYDMMETYLRSSLDNFLNLGHVWRKWASTQIDDNAVRIWLEEFTNNSVKLTDQLFAYYVIESHKMGKTLWSLFNALTYWSTHEQVKQSSQANQAAVAVERERRVSKAITGKGFAFDIFKAAA